MADRKRVLLKILLLLFIIFTLVFIWGNSLVDSQQSSDMSRGLLQKLQPQLKGFGIHLYNDVPLRKFAHFAEYAMLGSEFAFMVWLNRKSGFRSFLVCAVLCLMVAITDEIIQLFVGRYGHIHDVMLDLFGGCTGIAAIFWLHKLIREQ